MSVAHGSLANLDAVRVDSGWGVVGRGISDGFDSSSKAASHNRLRYSRLFSSLS